MTAEVDYPQSIERSRCRRITVFGWGPLPFEEARMHFAPATRTWQFASALAADGHDVSVICVPIPGSQVSANAGDRRRSRDGIEIEHCRLSEGGRVVGVESAFRRLDPELVVGAAQVPSSWAAELADDRPLWVDLFGDLMAEAHARAIAGVEDDPITACRDLLARLLELGDAFSVVSDRQRWAVIGQLGIAGRLGVSRSMAHRVHVVPCGTEMTRPRPVTRPADVAPDDVVALWSGGFNTWADVDTLVAAFEQAIERQPNLLLVVTGGPIVGHDESTFPRWSERIAASSAASRYRFKGFLSRDELERYVHHASVGLVTERDIAERWLGSSGRIAGWLAAGLPVICTPLSELGRQVCESGLGLVYQPGSASSLADALVAFSASPERRRAASERAWQYAAERLDFATTTAPLRRWAAEEDLDMKRERPPWRPLTEIVAAERRLDELSRSNAALAARLADVSGELDAIKRSRSWRWVNAMWKLRARTRIRRGTRTPEDTEMP